MSKDTVKQMFGKMEKDAGLKAKYSELMQAHKKEAEKTLADKIIEFGKSSGFSFSKDELMAARVELIEKINENKELADKDLASVAGGGPGNAGKSYGILLSTLTFGVGCLIVSTIEDSKKPGGCIDNLSH